MKSRGIPSVEEFQEENRSRVPGLLHARHRLPDAFISPSPVGCIHTHRIRKPLCMCRASLVYTPKSFTNIKYHIKLTDPSISDRTTSFSAEVSDAREKLSTKTRTVVHVYIERYNQQRRNEKAAITDSASYR